MKLKTKFRHNVYNTLSKHLKIQLYEYPEDEILLTNLSTFMVDSYYSFIKLHHRPTLLFKLIPINKNIIEIFNLYDKCFHFRNFKNTGRTEISFTLDLNRHEMIEIIEILIDVLGTEHVSITGEYMPWINIKNIANNNELIDKFIYATSLIKLRFPVLTGSEHENVVNFKEDAYYKIVQRLHKY